jgi:hypothetical protein
MLNSVKMVFDRKAQTGLKPKKFLSASLDATELNRRPAHLMLLSVTETGRKTK